jgi:hypothetical protein
MDLWYSGKWGNNHTFDIHRVDSRILTYSVWMDGKHKTIEGFSSRPNGVETFTIQEGRFDFPEIWGVGDLAWPKFLPRGPFEVYLIQLSVDRGKTCHLGEEEMDWMNRIRRMSPIYK